MRNNVNRFGRKNVGSSAVQGTGHGALDTRMTRGQFGKAVGLGAAGAIGAGLFGSSVARAAYDEPPYVDYVFPQSDGSVWVYPLNWANEFGGETYQWYTQAEVEGYVIDNTSLPNLNDETHKVPVVSGNAPNAPAYPNVEIPKDFSKGYIFKVEVMGCGGMDGDC